MQHFFATEPRELSMDKSTAQSISISWKKPFPNTEPIAAYTALAVTRYKKQFSCTPTQDPDADSLTCEFVKLDPCLRYEISVHACGKDSNCGENAIGNNATLPGSKCCEGPIQ